MFVFILLSFFSYVSILVWYFKQKEKFEDVNKLPGPPTTWLLGNYTEFGRDLHEVFENCNRLIQTYGTMVRIWLGRFNVHLFITEPDLVEFFLSSNDHITKSNNYDLLKCWMGNGLALSTGDTWRLHRKVLTPAFHFTILQKFTINFHNNAQMLIKILRKKSGETVNIYPIMKNYAFDTICESSMGINFQSQQNSNSVYPVLLETLEQKLMERYTSVFKRNNFIFPLTAEGRNVRTVLNTIQTITRNVIQNRRKHIINGSVLANEDDHEIKKRKIFLDAILESPEFTSQDIEWQVNTFLFGGHDTISTSLSFTLYELAKHPEIQQNMLNEIMQVVGQDREGTVTQNMLRNLPYLDRVLKESLRMYPPVPRFERKLLEDVYIAGLKIPKETTISFHPYSQHRNPKLYPRPEKFDPDRFLPENTLTRHPYAYIPFSAGPRNCIGQKYALTNIKVVLVNIVRNFKLYPADFEHCPILAIHAVIKAKNGLPVKLVYRE